MIKNMNINETRVRKLKQLVTEYGSQNKLSEASGINPSYISQMVNGFRAIGEKTARGIEDSLKLKHLWLDELVNSESSIDQAIQRELALLDDSEKAFFLRQIRGMNKSDE